MVIRKILFLFIIIMVIGCGNKSNITVYICNVSNSVIRDVTLEWKDGKYSFNTLSEGSCEKVKLFNIKSESSLIVSTNKYTYPIDVYIESENYFGSIKVKLGENNISFQDNITVR